MDDTPMPETLDTIAAKITALSQTVQGGFARIDERFARVDERFDKVDERLAKVDERLDKVDERLDKVDKRFETVDARFDKVDQRLSDGDKTIATLDERFVDFRAHLGIKIEALEDKIDLVYDVLIAQQKQFTANEKAHGTFDERLDNHDLRILALEPPKHVS